ncbi:FAD-binding oxidoreductase [Pseudomonas aeruginosa]|uniref:FAD-binding oxidoreductase n=1 Tax=Pseudomonas aeruginosa TaxID=287 RepID=UPI0035695E69
MSLPIPFLKTVERLIPRERRFDDPLSTLAFGTDASFYRLIPKLVLRVESEDEVAAILSAAYREQVPVTFRAAGTSLSGQAISDSVLLVLGDNWNGREIRADGAQIRLAEEHHRPVAERAGRLRRAAGHPHPPDGRLRGHPRLHQRGDLRHRPGTPAQGLGAAGFPHGGNLLHGGRGAQAPAGLGGGTARSAQPALG